MYNYWCIADSESAGQYIFMRAKHIFVVFCLKPIVFCFKQKSTRESTRNPRVLNIHRLVGKHVHRWLCWMYFICFFMYLRPTILYKEIKNVMISLKNPSKWPIMYLQYWWRPNQFLFVCEGGGGHFAGEKVKWSPGKYCDPQKQMHCENRHEFKKCKM